MADTTSPAPTAASPAAEVSPASTSPQPSNSPAAPPQAIVGIDFGTQSSVVSVSFDTTEEQRHALPRIVPNNLSNQLTPSLVAFGEEGRLVGEEAVTTKVRRPAMCAANLKRLLAADQATATAWCTVQSSATPQGGISFTMGEASYSAEQLAGMMLTKLRAYTEAYVAQQQPGAQLSSCVVAVPPSFGDAQRQAVADAARIAGLDLVAIANDTTCSAMAYGFAHPLGSSVAEKESVVLFIDQGHAYTSASVVKFCKESLVVLGSASEADLGSSSIDDRMCAHALERFKALKGLDASRNARSMARLRAACEKTKAVLSTIPETVLEVDVFCEDTDLRLPFTRAALEDMCKDVLARMGDVAVRALKAAGLASTASLASIEAIGGGFRSPLVQQCVVRALTDFNAASGAAPAPDAPAVAISRSLDSASSVATGAALIAEMVRGKFVVAGYSVADPGFVAAPAGRLSDADLAAAVETEKALLAEEERRVARARAHDQLELYIYQTRAGAGEKKGSDVLSAAEHDAVLALLQADQDWLQDSRPPLEELSERHAKLREAVKAAAPKWHEYLVAQEEEKRRLAEEAAKWKPTTDGATAAKREPRTKVEKIKACQKRKDQGNILFKEMDYAGASLKYSQGLSYLDCIADLSPEERKQVDDLKLSLHLNLALCYQKTNQSASRIFDNLNAALSIDAKNVKALYRRAQTHMGTKDYEKAEADLRAVLEVDPANVLAKKELSTVAQLRQKEKDRQRRMAQAMFGGLGADEPAAASQ
eukprot:m51a1_g4637 hypothetical protein (765) ;mRNA; r:334971-337882